MEKIIQARVNSETLDAIDEIEIKLGINRSELIRNAVEYYRKSLNTETDRKFIGLGKFASSISDLGSNKKHLKNFGK